MKIRKLTIKNVTSYNEETAFEFDSRLNILIGPNGGGKSNLQKILAITLSTFFLHQYDFTQEDGKNTIKQVNLWDRRALRESLDRFLGCSDDQVIGLEIFPEEHDARNIVTIAKNLNRFNERLLYWENPYQEYLPHKYIDQIRSVQILKYEIINLEEPHLAEDSAEFAFRRYLQTFSIFQRIADRLSDIQLSAPIFFFFSERTFARDIKVQPTQFADQQYFSGARTGYQTALGASSSHIQWATQHFARLHWRAIHAVSGGGSRSARDVLYENKPVQYLSKYMNRLGCDWDFFTDEEHIAYIFKLISHDAIADITKFSSGEKEIVHFLLAIFAYNVTDGVVLLDEPELHLHPRWQRIFLELFKEISTDRNNQFIIATHSPVFVSPATIGGVMRLYRAREGSKLVDLKKAGLPNEKGLVRMINSYNNEKLFFSDRVILVEGITDKLVLERLVNDLVKALSINEAIDVIDVGGKHNFPDYKLLADSLKLPYCIVADRDYLRQVGSNSVRALFVSDAGKVLKSLFGKKSKDARVFIDELNGAIKDKNTLRLTQFLAYARSRQCTLRFPLSPDELASLENDIALLSSQGIFILSRGEIENYMPLGIRELKDIITWLDDENWLERMERTARKELLRIVLGILRLNLGDMRSFYRHRRQMRGSLV